MLTGSTKYQGIDGYVCDNVVCCYDFENSVNMTDTYEQSSYLLFGGRVFTLVHHKLSSVRRTGIYLSTS